MANSLCIMTYNIHRCIGMDRKTSPDRIASVIAGYNPDIVALQEVDCGRVRPALNDQATIIAERLTVLAPASSSFGVERERCGNVILSRYPMKLVKAGGLRMTKRWRASSNRGAIWVEIDVFGSRIQIINTHLGLTPPERLSQAKILAGPEWLGNPAFRPPAVLCGDLNAQPGSSVHKIISKAFENADDTCASCRPEKTWPSPHPFLNIDHFFISDGLSVASIDVPLTDLTRVASDHLPIVTLLKLQNQTTRSSN